MALTSELDDDLDEARATYLLALEANPDDVDALAALGQLSLKQGELPAALDYLQRATTLKPRRLGLRCKVAQIFTDLKRFDEARATFESVLRVDAANVNALAGLGQLIRQQGDAAAALTFLQRATELDPARLGLRCKVAQMLRGLNRVDEARAAYLSVLETDPVNVNALAGLGQISRQQGDMSAALEYLMRATDLEPARLGLRCEVAQLFRGLHRADEARAMYLSVLETDPANVNAVTGLAQLSQQQGDVPGALEQLQRASGLDPTSVGPRFRNAQMLRSLNRLDEARAAYLSVLQADPRHIAALTEMGLLERQQGDDTASLVFLTTALASQPTSAALMAEVGVTLRQLGRLDEAEAMYKKGIQADPRSIASLRGLCHIAVARGQLSAAIEFAQAACAVDPQNLNSKLFLSSLYRDTGRMAEARVVVEEALAAGPDHPGTWMEYGYLLRDCSERASALSAFQRAAHLNHERAWIEVATEHLALGQTQPARQVYEATLKSTPQQFDALMGVANLQTLTGDYAACIETCDSVIATYPKRLAAHRLKCLALIQLDRAEEAVRIADGLEADGPMLAESDAIRLEVFRMCGMSARARGLLADPRVAESKVFSLWIQNVQTRLAIFDLAGAQAALENRPALRSHERARTLFAKGTLADRQWRIREAIVEFEGAVGVQSHDPGAHENLARLYLLMADIDRVSHHLQLMLEQRASSLSLRGQSKNISQNMIGQLLNELKLDIPLATRLAGLLDKEPTHRIEELCNIVRVEPGLTPPAMYLMLTLRQSGAFKEVLPPSDARQTPESPVPLKIMQFWDRPRPPTAISKLLRTWIDAHPDYEYRRFDKSSARDYLAANYSAEVQRAFQRSSHPAQASDIFRLAYLLREGGFYVDADDRCVGHLSNISSPNVRFIAYQEQFATLGNNFLGCVPDEPVIEHALNLAVEAMNRGDNETIWLATGPGVLTRAFAQVFAAQGNSWPEWLRRRRILDRTRLFEVSWPHSIMYYKNTRLNWLRRVFKSRPAAPS